GVLVARLAAHAAVGGVARRVGAQVLAARGGQSPVGLPAVGRALARGDAAVVAVHLGAMRALRAIVVGGEARDALARALVAPRVGRVALGVGRAAPRRRARAGPGVAQ